MSPNLLKIFRVDKFLTNIVNKMSIPYPGINANKENSIILEQRGKNEVILFENYALASLATQEFESMRKNYTKIVDAYGCLGVLVRKDN